MNLEWKQSAYGKSEIAVFRGERLALVYCRRGEIHAFVGQRRLENSKTKKEALKRILEAIAIQPRLF